jgi:hypothetical protein
MLKSPSRSLPVGSRSAASRAAVVDTPVDGTRNDVAMIEGPVFDIRRAIGIAFLIHGVVLVVLGAAASHRDIASGFEVSLYTGTGMLAIAIAILSWTRCRLSASQAMSQ